MSTLQFPRIAAQGHAPAAAAAVLLFASTCVALTPATTITFDDFPFQPVDGFVHPAGVAFGFAVNGVPDLDANYASGGPGTSTFVDDPSIEGTTAGVLSLDFDLPTPILEFGVAVSDVATRVDAVLVELFDSSGGPVFSGSLTLEPLVMFSEAQFVFTGSPIRSATIDFTPSIDAGRFAFDNLTFSAIPEPASAMLALGGLVCGGAARRRRIV